MEQDMKDFIDFVCDLFLMLEALHLSRSAIKMSPDNTKPL